MEKNAQYLWNDLLLFLQTNTKNSADYSIALTFIKRLHQIPYSKIEEFAFHANVTPSTITKFCKKIGYEGFNELKECLRKFEKTETQVNYIKRNYPKSQYEDAFLIYDSRLTSKFFDTLKNNDKIGKLISLISANTKICIISPEYAANSAIIFTKTCFENGINCIQIARRSEELLMIEIVKSCNIIIIISSTGNWIKKSNELVIKFLDEDVDVFLVGSDELKSLESNYPSISLISLGTRDTLLNSHYNSSRLFALFFTYLSLSI